MARLCLPLLVALLLPKVVVAIDPSVSQPFFVPNRGQAPAPVRFSARQSGFNAQFADKSVSFASGNSRLQMEFVGAGPQSSVQATPGGDTLVYRNTWSGIETQYTPHRQHLKAEYHVAAGANPALIRLRYGNQARPRLLGDGSLCVDLNGTELLESPPYVYQDKGARVQVESTYRVYDDGTVGFSIGTYDPALPLVIDPVINYSSLFGGANQTSVTAVALDSVGNAVIAGWTTSTDLPANGAKTKNGGGVDAFVAKMSMEGNQIVWCTYLGGTGDDRAFGIALDSSNNVYVTGYTTSTNFPVSSALQAKNGGGRDAFVTKLNSAGTAILYSTYLGGSNYDQGNSITVDSSGAAYVTGDTSSINFPVVSAYQLMLHGQQDAFVSKLSPAGTALVYSTFLGGTAEDHGASIALGPGNVAYITGSTYSANFPLALPTQSRIAGGQDAFLLELNAAGNGLLFSTFIGGSGGTAGLSECGNGVAVDVAGNVYVAGVTSSIDFPTTAGAFERTLTNGGAEDHGFVWKIKADKSQILYSTYLAGLNLDLIKGLAVDPAGNAYLTGSTSSADFPGVRAFQPAITGTTNAFLAKLNASGSGLIFSSFLGGSNSDSGTSIAVDSRQTVLIGGLASSSDFPVLNAAQSYSRGTYSGFITRIVCGWYPVAFLNGSLYGDIWHDGGSNGVAWDGAIWSFGQTGDLPILGDWTGVGSTRIGVFRNGLWILDSNGNGYADAGDRQFTFGQAGDLPIVGDWNGSGTIKAGLFRHGTFILDLSGHLSGIPTGQPDLVFNYGNDGDVPVAADWGNTGITKIGIFRNGMWVLDTNNSHSSDPTDAVYYYGLAGDTPLVGDWNGSGTPKIGICRKGLWILNIAGDNQFHAGVDLQFYFSNSLYTGFLIGH